MRTLDTRLIAEHDYLLVPPPAWQEPVWQTISGQHMALNVYHAQQHLFPVLVQIEALTQDQTLAIWEATIAWQADHDTPFIGALLQAFDIDRVPGHLRRRSIFQPPSEPMHLVRYYDPRVYRHLRWVLTPEQHATLLGPVVAWTWQDRDGTWHTDEPDAPAADSASLRYTPKQWAQISRIEWIERGLNHLNNIDPTLIKDETAVSQRLDTLLDEAMNTYGLSHDNDLNLYIEHAFRLHPEIHRHPELQARLEQVKAGRRYKAVCSDLSAEKWARCADELNDGTAFDPPQYATK